MLQKIKSYFSEQSAIRLLYHKFKAILAAIFYRFPANKMHIIAVTGTKGKTSTVNLIAEILHQSGHRVGMVSTVAYRIADKKWSNTEKMTTTGPFALQKMLRQMLQAGCKFVVLEVSSHALIQSRTWGINVDTAVWTNLSNDHLEYHGSFTEYMKAKGLLFQGLMRSKRKPNIPKVAVLNKDDEHFDYFDQFPADQKYYFGMKEGIVRASNIQLHPQSTEFDLLIPNGQTRVNMNLPGEVNVANALAAVTACLTLNITLDGLKKALESIKGIPGRFEFLDCGQKFSVIIDYAHTEESLEQLLKMYRKISQKQLLLVFGATGGGRDKAKRPLMGQVADKYADQIFLTNDDPYEESQIAIIDQIAQGIKRQEGQKMWKIPDRHEAIRLALTMAHEGDIVIIAGKGCEEVQAINGQMVPWDDRKVVRELLTREVIIEINGKMEHRENVCKAV